MLQIQRGEQAGARNEWPSEGEGRGERRASQASHATTDATRVSQTHVATHRRGANCADSVALAERHLATGPP